MLLSMKGGSARMKNQPAAVGNDRGPRSIVSGLLFTMNCATPTCRGLSARGPPIRVSATLGHARSGVTAKPTPISRWFAHRSRAIICTAACMMRMPAYKDEAMDIRGRRAASRRVNVLGAMLALLAATGMASAQNFPSRPLTLVVPFAAGGPSDVAGRILAQGLGEVLGQQAAVGTRSGAGRTVGRSEEHTSELQSLRH